MFMKYTKLYDNIVHGHINDSVKLIHNGIDLNTPCGSFSNTPLHISSMKGQVEIIKLLLAKGVEVNAKNRFGETPLHLSVMMGNDKLTKILLDHNADPTIENDLGEKPYNQAFIFSI